MKIKDKMGGGSVDIYNLSSVCVCVCVFGLPIFWKYESQSVRTEWHVTNSAVNPLILSEEKDKA